MQVRSWPVAKAVGSTTSILLSDGGVLVAANLDEMAEGVI